MFARTENVETVGGLSGPQQTVKRSGVRVSLWSYMARTLYRLVVVDSTKGEITVAVASLLIGLWSALSYSSAHFPEWWPVALGVSLVTLGTVQVIFLFQDEVEGRRVCSLMQAAVWSFMAATLWSVPNEHIGKILTTVFAASSVWSFGQIVWIKATGVCPFKVPPNR